jgi:hypothetical protein
MATQHHLQQFNAIKASWEGIDLKEFIEMI